MRVVTAGNANSLLVRETRPGAAMCVNFSGWPRVEVRPDPSLGRQ